MLTEKDSGRTITLRVGERFDVFLGAEYRQPVATGKAITRSSASGGYPSGQPAKATFRAVTVGQADVETSTDYACLHTTPRCGIPQRAWSVHVVVRS